MAQQHKRTTRKPRKCMDPTWTQRHKPAEQVSKAKRGEEDFEARQRRLDAEAEEVLMAEEEEWDRRMRGDRERAGALFEGYTRRLDGAFDELWKEAGGLERLYAAEAEAEAARQVVEDQQAQDRDARTAAWVATQAWSTPMHKDSLVRAAYSAKLEERKASFEDRCSRNRSRKEATRARIAANAVERRHKPRADGWRRCALGEVQA